jgi:hypothetical protein
LIGRVQRKESPAPGPRGAFNSDQSKPQPVGSNNKVKVCSDQAASREALVEQQIAYVSASCAMQACLVWEGDRTDHWGRVMAERLADKIGLTRSVGADYVKALLREKFSNGLADARSGRINVRTARNASDQHLLAVFEGQRALTVLRVQNREIEPEAGAEELNEFINSNARLTAKVRMADLNRMASIPSLQREPA